MKSILDQQGATSLEATIIMACFAFVAIIAILAMCAQGGTDVIEVVTTIESDIEEAIEDVDWQQEIDDAREAKQEIEHEVCCTLCEVDYNAGVYNVVDYQNCLGNCSQ